MLGRVDTRLSVDQSIADTGFVADKHGMGRIEFKFQAKGADHYTQIIHITHMGLAPYTFQQCSMGENAASRLHQCFQNGKFARGQGDRFVAARNFMARGIKPQRAEFQNLFGLS